MQTVYQTHHQYHLARAATGKIFEEFRVALEKHT